MGFNINASKIINAIHRIIVPHGQTGHDTLNEPTIRTKEQKPSLTMEFSIYIKYLFCIPIILSGEDVVFLNNSVAGSV